MEVDDAQYQITKARGNSLMEKKGKREENYFRDLMIAFPHAMIDEAKSLQRVAQELKQNKSESSQSDSFLFRGKHQAVPILLSLATEIALKTWQLREGKKKPDQTHDLLKLFERLKPDTQKMLEERMQKLSPPAPFFATKHPLRDVLCSHKDAFERWRYSYETFSSGGAWFETGEIDRALTALVDAYHDNKPDE